jgi:hypothetical protein
VKGTPDLVRYQLRGTAGDEKENEALELGAELVVVLRGVVSKIAERTNGESLVVCDTYLTATTAVVIDGPLPAGIRKQLDAAAAAAIEGTDRLL